MGGVPGGCLPHPRPCEQNHRRLWKRNLAATTLRTVMSINGPWNKSDCLLWLRNPEETSPEVRNMGISGPKNGHTLTISLSHRNVTYNWYDNSLRRAGYRTAKIRVKLKLSIGQWCKCTCTAEECRSCVCWIRRAVFVVGVHGPRVGTCTEIHDTWFCLLLFVCTHLPRQVLGSSCTVVYLDLWLKNGCPRKQA